MIGQAAAAIAPSVRKVNECPPLSRFIFSRFFYSSWLSFVVTWLAGCCGPGVFFSH